MRPIILPVLPWTVVIPQMLFQQRACAATESNVIKCGQLQRGWQPHKNMQSMSTVSEKRYRERGADEITEKKTAEHC